MWKGIHVRLLFTNVLLDQFDKFQFCWGNPAGRPTVPGRGGGGREAQNHAKRLAGIQIAPVIAPKGAMGAIFENPGPPCPPLSSETPNQANQNLLKPLQTPPASHGTPPERRGSTS